MFDKINVLPVWVSAPVPLIMPDMVVVPPFNSIVSKVPLFAMAPERVMPPLVVIFPPVPVNDNCLFMEPVVEPKSKDPPPLIAIGVDAAVAPSELLTPPFAIVEGIIDPPVMIVAPV